MIWTKILPVRQGINTFLIPYITDFLISRCMIFTGCLALQNGWVEMLA